MNMFSSEIILAFSHGCMTHTMYAITVIGITIVLTAAKTIHMIFVIPPIEGSLAYAAA